jgi:hypothetical protein
VTYRPRQIQCRSRRNILDFLARNSSSSLVRECASTILDFDGPAINLEEQEATVKRTRPREGSGEARLLHCRTTAEVAECLAERVAAVRVVKREQAGGHLRHSRPIPVTTVYTVEDTCDLYLRHSAGGRVLYRDFRPRSRLHRGVEGGRHGVTPAEGVDGGKYAHVPARRRPASEASRPSDARGGLLFRNRVPFFLPFYLSTRLHIQ